MAFPSTVNKTLAFGIPGEFYADGPCRVRHGILQSSDTKTTCLVGHFASLAITLALAAMLIILSGS